MSERIEFSPRIYTRDIVNYLISCRDQCASTKDISENVSCGEFSEALRSALERLRKVGRIDEIHPNLWHLE